MSDQDTFEQIGGAAKRVVMEADPWSWWRAALDNPKAIGKTLKVTTSPEWGRYRVRNKNSPWEPVAIWQLDNGDWIAVRGREQHKVHADDIWTWCCRYPISLDEYDNVVAGADFSDVDAVVDAQRRGPPKPGDNAGDRSESEMLADDIKAALDQLRQYKAIADDEQAGKAQSLRSRLLELHRKADKIREKQVRPHLDAQTAINGEWQPLVKDAKGGADALRKTLEGYESGKLAKRRAEEEAARRAAEAAEEARQEAEQSFVTPEPGPEAEAAAAPAPAPAPVPETTIKGSYGRAASVKAVMEVAEITDVDALFGFLKTHKELVAKMFELAKRAHGAGHVVPGVRLEERATVR